HAATSGTSAQAALQKAPAPAVRRRTDIPMHDDRVRFARSLLPPMAALDRSGDAPPAPRVGWRRGNRRAADFLTGSATATTADRCYSDGERISGHWARWILALTLPSKDARDCGSTPLRATLPGGAGS